MPYAPTSRFVDEYLLDSNAIQAAETSGEFSPNHPDSGYYVYLLVDPRSNQVFYVGKGIRSRAKSHARDARSGTIGNVRKYRAIRDIHKAGHEAGILYCPMQTERQAFQFERYLISRLKSTGITNQVSGTTTVEERVSAGAQHNLDAMKSREQWMRDLTPDLIDVAVRVFGSLDACYDNVLAGLTKLSQITDR